MDKGVTRAVVIQKVASIERCLHRIREEFDRDDLPFSENLSAQDAATLNIQRACEQVISIANYLIRTQKWGSPTSRADAIHTLSSQQLISVELADRLKKMQGFRNLAVHEYQKLEIQILINIIEKRLVDFEAFTNAVLEFTTDEE